MDHWDECISEALDDAGITATKEQIKNIAGWVQGAHENYGMAYGHDCIPNPLQTEIDTLKKKREKEIAYNDKIYTEELKERADVIRDKNSTIWNLERQLEDRNI